MSMEQELDVLAALITQAPEGLSRGALHEQLPALSLAQLKYRLELLVEQGRVRAQGRTRARVYLPVESPGSGGADEPAPRPSPRQGERGADAHPFFSRESMQRFARLEVAHTQRARVGYEPSILPSYELASPYLSDARREQLHALGKVHIEGLSEAPAGTYARQILERLLIDLSWASSHLEGNTYSMLETERLLRLGEVAEGKALEEATMLLNHKRAIELLVAQAEHLRMDSYTLRGLHATLTADLLADPADCGQLRQRPVFISGSSYTPLTIPQRIREAFELLLAIARQLDDPFEQSFLTFIHLQRLQPFVDGNKRTARLAANIPLIVHNLIPLSFTDVEREDYLRATLTFYETQETEPLAELFCHAYTRSAMLYNATAGELTIDRFRLRHRAHIFEAVRALVTSLPPDPVRFAEDHVAQLPLPLDPIERARLVALILGDLDGLHEGNIFRYALTPSTFQRWTEREHV